MRLELGPCVVRHWSPGDADALVRHANNRNVWINLRDRFPHPYLPEHAQRFVEWACGQDPLTVWALEVDGEAAGAIGIERHSDVERVSAEIGYWLGEQFWNRGVVSAALKAITDLSFQNFEVTRIYALPFADNIGSIRVLEKAGYVLEGRLRQSAIKEGKIRDQLLYATYR